MSQRPSRPFPAQFPGTCSGCGWDINEGDKIVMWRGIPYHNDEECCSGLQTDGRGVNEMRDPWE